MSFRILTSTPILGELPLTIATAQLADDGDTITAEYFVSIHTDKEEHYFPMQLHHSSSEKTRQTFGINEDFMLKQAIDAAQWKLDSYLNHRYEETKNHVFLDKRFGLQEIDKSQLIGFYLRGFFEKQLKAIRDGTVSEALAQTLSEIFRLRTIFFDG